MDDTIFDLEQKILQFANILDDLETFVSKIEEKYQLSKKTKILDTEDDEKQDE